MRTISLTEFENLVALSDWQRVQEHEVLDSFNYLHKSWDPENNAFGAIKVPYGLGVVSKSSYLDGIEIDYTEFFRFDKSAPESMLYEASKRDGSWCVIGLVVVDEDGNTLSDSDLGSYLNSDFSRIDYKQIASEIKRAADIDAVDVGTMKTFTLEIDNAPSIRFTGQLVAHVDSCSGHLAEIHNGNPGRWTELSLYKTKGGKFVCHQIGRTRWDGEVDRFSGVVCDTLSEVKAFFGHRRLAKELYAAACIEDVVEVD